MNQKKKPGRPKVIGVKRSKLVRVCGAVLPSVRDEIDRAVLANGTSSRQERSEWIADAIIKKLNRRKKANRKS